MPAGVVANHPIRRGKSSDLPRPHFPCAADGVDEKKRRRLRIAIDLVADRRAIAADFVRHALCLEENGLGLALQHDVEFVAALARTTGHERMAAFGWHEREDRIDFIEW